MKASCTQKLWEQVGTCGIPVSMRFSAVPTPEKVVGTGGNKPNPQILRIELLASYAHEIALSAVALHYGWITADSLFPLFPQAKKLWEHENPHGYWLAACSHCSHRKTG